MEYRKLPHGEEKISVLGLGSSSIGGAGEKEIQSKKIGEMVMERIKDLDEVSYVRFASVYRQFKDINTFREELDKIVNEKQKE